MCDLYIYIVAYIYIYSYVYVYIYRSMIYLSIYISFNTRLMQPKLLFQQNMRARLLQIQLLLAFLQSLTSGT
jgi:hypothetical protein